MHVLSMLKDRSHIQLNAKSTMCLKSISSFLDPTLPSLLLVEQMEQKFCWKHLLFGSFLHLIPFQTAFFSRFLLEILHFLALSIKSEHLSWYKKCHPESNPCWQLVAPRNSLGSSSGPCLVHQVLVSQKFSHFMCLFSLEAQCQGEKTWDY